MFHDTGKYYMRSKNEVINVKYCPVDNDMM